MTKYSKIQKYPRKTPPLMCPNFLFIDFYKPEQFDVAAFGSIQGIHARFSELKEKLHGRIYMLYFVKMSRICKKEFNVTIGISKFHSRGILYQVNFYYCITISILLTYFIYYFLIFRMRYNEIPRKSLETIWFKLTTNCH